MCAEIECGDEQGQAQVHAAPCEHAAGAGAPPPRARSAPRRRPSSARSSSTSSRWPAPRTRRSRRGAAHDGRGAAPRLPDAAPAARGRLDARSPSRSSADMVEEILSMTHRLPRPGRLQHRLRLVRRQHRLLRPDRPRRQVPARHAEDLAPTSRWPRACRRCCARRRSTSPPASCRCAAGWSRRREGEVDDHHGGDPEGASTSGCRAASRCSATSAAAAPTCKLRPEADEERARRRTSTTKRSRRWSATSTCATLRARLPEPHRDHAEADARPRSRRERGAVEGVRCEDLLRLPHRDFFRRRGVPAFTMIGVDGETLRRRRGLPARTSRARCRTATAPTATSRTSSTRCGRWRAAR